jgi:hypothetical protein
MIRLQLAMERNDRHVALQAVDGLVALDRQLQHYLEAVPASGEQLMFRRELDAERAALNHEKLTLAAGVLRRPQPANSVGVDEDDWLGPPDLISEPEEPPRKRWWLAAVPVFAAGVAAAAYFVSVPDLAGWITAAAGMVR